MPQVSHHRRLHHKDRESRQIDLRSRNKQESLKVGTQRNTLSKKEKKSPERVLNEIEASKLSDTEFKVMVMRMLNEISENYKELQESYKEPTANYASMKKDIETINKSQEEMKNKIYEMKNTEQIKSRLDETAS